LIDQLASGANAGGTLAVSGGAAVETLTLLGQYTAANFSAASAGVEFRDTNAADGAPLTRAGRTHRAAVRRPASAMFAHRDATARGGRPQ
jgi:hypothetical protein